MCVCCVGLHCVPVVLRDMSTRVCLHARGVCHACVPMTEKLV